MSLVPARPLSQRIALRLESFRCEWRGHLARIALLLGINTASFLLWLRLTS